MPFKVASETVFRIVHRRHDRSFRRERRHIAKRDCNAVKVGRVFGELIGVGENVRGRGIDNVKEKPDILFF